MKTKVIDLRWDDPKLKILIGGSYDDASCIILSCKEDEIPLCQRKKSQGKRGCCALIRDPKKDPDNASILIWLNIDYINNGQIQLGKYSVDDVLLHEIVHVKQLLEKKLVGPDEKMPIELEAKIITDLYQRAKKAIEED